jgi:hypothetical protein
MTVFQQANTITQGQSASGVADVHILLSQTGTRLTQVITAVEKSWRNISVTQGQAVTLLRRIGRAVVSTLSLDASGVAVAHIRASQTGTGLGESVSVGRSFTVPRIVSVTQAQTAVLRRAMARIVVVSGALVLTVFRRSGRIVTLTQALTASLIAARSMSASDKVITLAQAHVVTLRRAPARVVTVAMAQAASGVAEAHLRISQTGTRLVQAITVARNFAVVKVLSFAQAQVLSLRRSIGHRIVLSRTYALIVVVEAHLRGTMGLPQIGQTVRVIRGVGHRIASALAHAVSLLQIKGAPRLVSVTQAQSVTVLRGVARLVNVVMAQAITLRRGMIRIVTLQLGQLVSRLTAVGHQIGLSHALAVTASAVKAAGATTSQIVSVIQGQVVSLVARRGGVVVINVATGITATLRRGAGKVVRITRSLILHVTRLVRIVATDPSRIVYVLAEFRSVLVSLLDRVVRGS